MQPPENPALIVIAISTSVSSNQHRIVFGKDYLGIHLCGAPLKDRPRLGHRLAYHGRDAMLDDAGLLGSNLFKRIPEVLHMVETYVCYD